MNNYINSPNYIEGRQKQILEESVKKLAQQPIDGIDEELRETLIRDAKEQLNCLQNINKTTLKDRFDNLKMSELYNTEYVFLSDHAHNSPHILLQRHAWNKLGLKNISRSNKLPKRQILYAVDIMVKIMFRSVVQVNIYFKSSNNKLLSIGNDHDKIRKYIEKRLQGVSFKMCK